MCRSRVRTHNIAHVLGVCVLPAISLVCMNRHPHHHLRQHRSLCTGRTAVALLELRPNEKKERRILPQALLPLPSPPLQLPSPLRASRTSSLQFCCSTSCTERNSARSFGEESIENDLRIGCTAKLSSFSLLLMSMHSSPMLAACQNFLDAFGVVVGGGAAALISVAAATATWDTTGSGR